MPHKDPEVRRLYHQRYREENRERLRAYYSTEEYRVKNLKRMNQYKKDHPEIVRATARRTWIRRRIREGKDPIGKCGPKPRPLADRFWEKVIKHDEGCWGWKASKHDSGYGLIDGMLASHASWIIHFGVVPEGLEVCHTCDNPECTRPDHLWLGTHGDNMRDAFAKGRIVHIPKTHCKHGHEFTLENTYIWRDRNGKNHRICRECSRIAYRNRKVA
jgi:hypothetical protein